MLCGAEREGRDGASQENIDKFGVIPNLFSEFFIVCKRSASPACEPFVQFANADWNDYWDLSVDERRNARDAAEVAAKMNSRKSHSADYMGYRIVRCLNQAKIPTEWSPVDQLSGYEIVDEETGKPRFKPIMKVNMCIDIDPWKLLVWTPKHH